MIFLFDVDGTLTPSRQKMDPDFKVWFLKFMEKNHVRLVTGSNIEKTIEQVGREITDNLVVHSCSGNQTYGFGKLLFESDWKLSDDARGWLNQQLASSAFHLRTGNHIEERPGMVNFSIIGRNANLEERALYVAYDKSCRERHFIAKRFNTLFPSLEARVGGETGLDISLKGFDKAQVLEFNINEEVVFFGDAMHEEGNDFPLKKAIEDQQRGVSHHVVDWEETQNILKNKYWDVKKNSNKGVSGYYEQ